MAQNKVIQDGKGRGHQAEVNSNNALKTYLSSGGEDISESNPLHIHDIDEAHRSNSNTVFGEKNIGIRRADIAAQFQYGFPSGSANIDIANGGTISVVESMLNVSTGTNIAGSAGISNKKALRYIPGHEAYIFFTAVFSEGKENSSQKSGIFDDQDGFFLGYEGVNFCATRRRAGIDYNEIIDISKVFDDGSFDPKKGNVYKISFGYLGFATITFEILNPNGRWDVLHQINYPNSQTVTHITNTNLQPRAEVENTGNNTDIILKSGSFTAGVVNGGGEDPAARRFTFGATEQSITAGELMVITFRSKQTFNSLTNYIQSLLTLLSFNTDLSKSSSWKLVKGMTITNTPNWIDVNTADSTMEYSTDAIVTSGTGEDNFLIPLGKVDRVLLDNLEEQGIELFPNETMTLLIQTPLGTSGTYDLSFRWKELF